MDLKSLSKDALREEGCLWLIYGTTQGNPSDVGLLINSTNSYSKFKTPKTISCSICVTSTTKQNLNKDPTAQIKAKTYHLNIMPKLKKKKKTSI